MDKIENKPRLLLFDMFNICIAMNAVKNITNSDAEQVGMYLGVLDMIRVISDRLKPDKVFCCYDGPEAGARRRSLYKDYKNKRKVKTRYSVVKIVDDEDNVSEYIQKGAFEEQLAKIYETSKYLPVQNFIIPGCEADDIIAYAALRYQKDYNVYIISRDKDYLQLINENIKVYNWNKKKLYDVESFHEEFKIPTENYIYLKILLGDVSDKIDGLKGVGKKTAELLHPFLNQRIYQGTEDFLKGFNELELYEFDTRSRNALVKLRSDEFIKKILLSYQLMKLDLDCLRMHHIDIFNKQLEEQEDKKLNRIQMMIKAQRGEFNRLYQGYNFDKWVMPFLFINKRKKIV